MSLIPRGSGARGVRQTGPSAILVSMYYISRTWSWVKVTIWLPSPPMGLTIHVGGEAGVAGATAAAMAAAA